MKVPYVEYSSRASAFGTKICTIDVTHQVSAEIRFRCLWCGFIGLTRASKSSKKKHHSLLFELFIPMTNNRSLSNLRWCKP
jgi:hypothetical protein